MTDGGSSNDAMRRGRREEGEMMRHKVTDIFEQRLNFCPNHTMNWMYYLKNDDVVITTPQFKQALRAFQIDMLQLNDDYYKKLLRAAAKKHLNYNHHNQRQYAEREEEAGEGGYNNNYDDVVQHQDEVGEEEEKPPLYFIHDYLHALEPHQKRLTDVYYSIAVGHAFDHWTFSYYTNEDPQRQWMLLDLRPHLFSSSLRLQQAWNAYSDFYKSHTAEMDLKSQNGFDYNTFRQLLMHVKQLQDTLYTEYRMAHQDYIINSTTPPSTP
jgi:hypothetical protein